MSDVDREARADYRNFRAEFPRLERYEDEPDVYLEPWIEEPDFTPPLPVFEDEDVEMETCGECLEETESTRGGLCPRCHEWANR